MDKRGNIIALCKAQMGIKETPPNSNLQKYGEWYGMNGVPWCGISVSWIYSQSGNPLGYIDTDKGFHYCPSAWNHFVKTKQTTEDPQPGDLVFLDWQKGKAGNNKLSDHVGIFYKWVNKDLGTFLCFEGNTAIGNDSNGGEYMLRSRSLVFVQGFVKPKVLS
jgi:hypothetical protein